MTIKTISDINESNLEEARKVLMGATGLPLLAYASVMNEGKVCTVLTDTILTNDDSEGVIEIPEGFLETLEVIDDSITTRLKNLATTVVDYNMPAQLLVQSMRTILVIGDIVPPTDPDNEYNKIVMETIKNHKNGLAYMMHQSL